MHSRTNWTDKTSKYPYKTLITHHQQYIDHAFFLDQFAARLCMIPWEVSCQGYRSLEPISGIYIEK